MTTSVHASPSQTSTIVRSWKRPVSQRAALSGIGALSRVSPGAAAWAGRAPVPDAPAICSARARARSSGPRAPRLGSRRGPADRDVDLGIGPADHAGPRLGRAGGPAGHVRRAPGRERLLGRVVRRPGSRRLGGTPRHDSPDGESPARRGRRPRPGARDRRALGRCGRQRLGDPTLAPRRLRRPAGGDRAHRAAGRLPRLLRAVRRGVPPVRRGARAVGPTAHRAGRAPGSIRSPALRRRSSRGRARRPRSGGRRGALDGGGRDRATPGRRPSS